jgi:hypothetical protein
MLQAMQRIEAIQIGMETRESVDSLAYIREARAGGIYTYRGPN